MPLVWWGVTPKFVDMPISTIMDTTWPNWTVQPLPTMKIFPRPLITLFLQGNKFIKRDASSSYLTSDIEKKVPF